MTWLTWRQFRAQAVVAAAGLAVLAIVLVITGLQLSHTFDTTVLGCQAHGDCAAADNALQGQDTALQDLTRLLMYAVPAVIGLFWGAPLLGRELETGTFRLAWTQGVTRARWFGVKLVLTGLASMATAGLLSLMVTWWYSPLERVGAARLTPGEFSLGGIVIIGYAAFAFALGVTAGLLARRTLPAMAITLAIFVAVQLAMPFLIRPHLIAPVRAVSALKVANVHSESIIGSGGGGTLSLGAAPDIPGSSSAWIYSAQVTTASGSTDLGPAPAHCGPNSGYNECQAAIARMHLRVVATYQPGSRYWAFQWYETAIYLAAALVLAGFCWWWVRRRVT
ncbi:MAG TPA: ABC transporter permease subunit [Streptosporangiaceae bacterium]|nr:ABC transporter permease subunit [Streptosporangiaceae bacterium]